MNKSSLLVVFLVLFLICGHVHSEEMKSLNVQKQTLEAAKPMSSKKVDFGSQKRILRKLRIQKRKLFQKLGFKKLRKNFRKQFRKGWNKRGLTKSQLIQKRITLTKMAKSLMRRAHDRKNLGVKCASRCMNKVKLVQGRKVRRCSWKKLKSLCYNKCRYGAKRCWKVCSKKDCFGKQVTVCRSKCVKNKKCRRECKYRKVKSCFFDRIPGKYIKTCSKVWKSKTFKTCLKLCTKKTTHCSKKCSKVRVVRKYKRCQRYLVERACETKKCSFGKYFSKCSAHCAKKKICGTKCKFERCDGGPKKRVCKYKCWTGRNCIKRCASVRQMKCYMLRIPAKYSNRCWNMLRSGTVKKCYKKCFNVVKVLARKVTTKPV
eukprot:gene12398-6065_t